MTTNNTPREGIDARERGDSLVRAPEQRILRALQQRLGRNHHVFLQPGDPDLHRHPRGRGADRRAVPDHARRDDRHGAISSPACCASFRSRSVSERSGMTDAVHLIRRADVALYEAKFAGKNRIVTAEGIKG
jgi:GGDEF domain-containing protein